MTNRLLVITGESITELPVAFDSDNVVTPEYDSVAVLQDYAEMKGVVYGKWHLLTGNRSEIYDLGRNRYFVEEDLGLEKDPDDFIHTENFVLVDGSRRIRGIYSGHNKAAISQLITDIKTLKKSLIENS